MSTNDEMMEHIKQLKAQTYSNLNPSEADLRELAYSQHYKYVEQDWDICVVSFDHRHLYLEFALDKKSPFNDLFLHMLYVLVGSLVYNVISSPMMYSLKKDKIFYGKPVKKPEQPIPKTVQDKITTILGELKSVDKPEIKYLCESIENKIVNADSGFDYDFWFVNGWIKHFKG